MMERKVPREERKKGRKERVEYIDVGGYCMIKLCS